MPSHDELQAENRELRTDLDTACGDRNSAFDEIALLKSQARELRARLEQAERLLRGYAHPDLQICGDEPCDACAILRFLFPSPPDSPVATCPCSNCDGPTEFIGKGLYMCLAEQPCKKPDSPVAAKCETWCGNGLPPDGVPGYGFIINALDVVTERFKLSGEGFRKRNCVFAWCSSECREKAIDGRDSKPAPAPDSNSLLAPVWAKLNGLERWVEQRLSEWQSMWVALDARVVALEKMAKKLDADIAERVPQHLGLTPYPAQPEAAAAPMCCDTSCRYYGQRHATAHELREAEATHAFVFSRFHDYCGAVVNGDYCKYRAGAPIHAVPGATK